MQIKAVAQQFHLTPSTLRYYEDQGLLDPITRVNGHRDYQPADLERLDFILCVKQCGMTLAQMKTFLDLYRQGNTTIPERLTVLQHQLAVSQARKAALARSIDHLQTKIADVQALQQDTVAEAKTRQPSVTSE
ncbi:MerR family transcriptional regulator [Levilactobacillus namurensis]|uniref:MerR family transcriptional regulator n=1 Tax=Levilactobacillus namurensis TaxID=380393 RepID=UPI001D580C90|nr:MerR family transcriptional regulator [Levilactobacillus namurensis]HJE45793.1 MerR family transcriptional regulator [Levilactobacillus namurensis]